MESTSSGRAEAPGLVLRSRTGAAYRFDPGALCLELLPTGGPGAFRRYETLHGPADLAAWAERCRLAPTPVLEITQEELASARRVRDALWRVVLARTEGAPPGASGDLRLVNEAAAQPPLAPAIGTGGALTWAGPGTGTQLLSTVARDAVDLLTGPHAHRIRMCAADDCQLVYVDTSRPGRRRWCSMEHCGNLHKVRTLRARRSVEESS
jgi:predicted RNA-binding Zn ribbon-like protein